MTLRSRIWSPMATPILGLGWKGDVWSALGKALAGMILYLKNLASQEPMGPPSRWPSKERD